MTTAFSVNEEERPRTYVRYMSNSNTLILYADQKNETVQYSMVHTYVEVSGSSVRDPQNRVSYDRQPELPAAGRLKPPQDFCHECA